MSEQSPYLVFLSDHPDGRRALSHATTPSSAAQSVLNSIDEFDHVDEGARLKGYVLNVPNGTVTRFEARYEGWHVKTV